MRIVLSGYLTVRAECQNNSQERQLSFRLLVRYPFEILITVHVLYVHASTNISPLCLNYSMFPSRSVLNALWNQRTEAPITISPTVQTAWKIRVQWFHRHLYGTLSTTMFLRKILKQSYSWYFPLNNRLRYHQKYFDSAQYNRRDFITTTCVLGIFHSVPHSPSTTAGIPFPPPVSLASFPFIYEFATHWSSSTRHNYTAMS